MGNLDKWGILERFYFFLFKLTSINVEVGNGEPKRFKNHLPTQNNF